MSRFRFSYIHLNYVFLIAITIYNICRIMLFYLEDLIALTTTTTNCDPIFPTLSGYLGKNNVCSFDFITH
jgi:hypothetical protein